MSARQTLSDPRWLPAARDAVDGFVAGLQSGIDSADAEIYNSDFGDDVMWGSPYGATLIGYDIRDRNILGIGLERIVDSAGGELIRVEAGTGDAAFNRVLSETSAYYLLGVAPEDRDRDGRTHRLDVELAQGGLSVRNRKQVLIPKR